MVLRPLEFSDCISDSPWFRQNLHEHEAALEEAYKNIKTIEGQCRELILCNKKLSQAQVTFAKSLSNFRIESVGMNQTDDERQIATCFGEFGRVLLQVEENREKIIAEAESQYLEPMRRFRQDVLGKMLHEQKKKYEKETTKFYASLDKHLHLSTVRKTDDDFREADAQLEMQQHNFCQSSLQYVEGVQSVQERLKFEFVEVMANFLYSWFSFFHIGYIVHEDFKPFLDAIQGNIAKTAENFKATQAETEELKKKILKTHTKVGAGKEGLSSTGDEPPPRQAIKQGYCYIQERSKIPKTLSRDVLKGTWSKYYCVYSRETRIFTMITVNAPTKTDMKSAVVQSSSFKLKQCVRRASDSIDKRFCLDITVDGRPEPITLQALSEEDRRQWIDAMDGTQPIYSSSAAGPSGAAAVETTTAIVRVVSSHMRSLSSRSSVVNGASSSPSPYSPQLSPLGMGIGGLMGGGGTGGPGSGGGLGAASGAIAAGLRSFHQGSAFLPAFVIEGCNAELDEIGFDFVRRCLKFIEDQGVSEQGLYRNCGVNSKVKKMMAVGLEKRKTNGEKGAAGGTGSSWVEEAEWETKTVSSALKTYLRNLPEPLMTFDLHSSFITAAKMDDRKQRIEHIHYHVYKLPKEHKEMLEIIIRHLRKVADRSAENLMTVGNLGVCFGPTLLRPREETMAAIMDIKFCNVVVEVLIDNCQQIFDTPPPLSIGPPKPEHSATVTSGGGGGGTTSSSASTTTTATYPSSDSSTTKDEAPPTARTASRAASTKESPTKKKTPTGSPKKAVHGERSGPQTDESGCGGSSSNGEDRMDGGGGGSDKDDRRIKRSAHVDSDRPRGRFMPSASSSRESGRGVAGGAGAADDSHSSSVEGRTSAPRARASCDSLDSLGSGGSESPRMVDAPVVRAKTSTSYAPSYHPMPSTSLDPSCSSFVPRSSPQSRLRPSGSSPRSGPPLESSLSFSGTSPLSASASSAPSRPEWSARSTRMSNGARGMGGASGGVGGAFGGGGASSTFGGPTSSSSSSCERISPIYAFVSPISSSSAPCVRVRTLYTCTPDHDSELSFEAGQIITNVSESKEDGWLVGTLNGKTGLIPANYVEHL